ncbi:MAG: hypothetical protein ABWZ93_17375 [Xanthobacteraceae bacterium]
MGGRDSGGHNSKGKLRDVQCARLDVHELAREGKLKLGTQGWLFGAVWFEVAGGPDAQRLVLEFPCRPASGEARDSVLLLAESAFWQAILMFVCSECNRSARVLYGKREPIHACIMS